MNLLISMFSGGQGSFFRLQNTEGLTLVGLFMEGTTLTCLETYSDAKKRTLVGALQDHENLSTDFSFTQAVSCVENIQLKFRMV
jgi:hypothetical protein